MAVIDQRRLHVSPRLAATLTAGDLFVPELSPVIETLKQPVMTRPWLDWARRLTTVARSAGQSGVWAAADHVSSDFASDVGPWTITTLNYDNYMVVGKTLCWNFWAAGTIPATTNAIYIHSPGNLALVPISGIAAVGYIYDGTETGGVMFADSAYRVTIRRYAPATIAATTTVIVGFSVCLPLA